MRRRIILYISFFSCFSYGSARAGPPPAPVAQTGQTRCYDGTRTGAIDCAGTGQDGDTLTGAAWPDPRFSDNGDQTVTDRLTGLAWTRDADPAVGYRSWRQALDYIKILNSRNHLGHADWRLPNVNELESLVNAQFNPAAWLNSKGFHNVRKDEYWTSSTYAAYSGCAWSVDMYGGILAGRGKAEVGRVWPVRRARAGAPALPKTGQTACHDDSGAAVACAGTGQDGESQEGAAWPSPRFSENADLTMTDRLTGLVWTRDGKTPGPAACMPGTRRTGLGAPAYIKCLNANRYLGRSDWRLPNRNELASLVNHGQPDTAAWLNAQGFSDVQAGGYRSSTTYVPTPWNAWGVNMHDGAVTSFAGKHDIAVWPVRGGR